MTHDHELLELLHRIEANQRKALEAQTEHLQLAQAQYAKSEAMVEESLRVQRTAVARQQRLALLVLPIILFLIVLVVWIAVKWRII
jgi:t-SNARE complex subunit (syntaxin)